MRTFIISAAMAFVIAAQCQAEGERVRYSITTGEVTLDTIDEGKGPLIVLLPSSARDSEDYDQLAQDLASSGFRVIRPQPRGAGESKGPTSGLTLHDLADDVALSIEKSGDGRAIVVGHAFGNWVARMTAVDHPELVRGVVIAAAASKNYPKDLLVSLREAGDPMLPDETRLKALQTAFFAPGNDPSSWLKGWHPDIAAYQRPIIADPKEDEWWSGGSAPILDLQALQDPFRPRSTADDLRKQFGDRVTIATIENASHALIPEQPQAVATEIATWANSLKP